MLLGLATGALRRSRSGFIYTGDDCVQRPFDPTSYKMAVAITSHFIAAVRLRGAETVLRDLQTNARGSAQGPIVRELIGDVERLASRHRLAARRSPANVR